MADEWGTRQSVRRREVIRAHLVHLRRAAVQGASNIRDVRDNSFATISASFQFAEDGRHLVAVLRIIDLFRKKAYGRQGIDREIIQRIKN